MKQPRIDFVKLLRGYKDGWVGISSDHTKVVLWGKTLSEARKRAEAIKEKVYFFPAGESYANFVGIICIDDDTI